MISPVPPLAPTHLPSHTAQRLRDLAARWTDVGAAERANYALYLIELCDALGVERPRPASAGGRVAEGEAYQFEFPVRTTTRDGAVSTNFIDLYKAGCFALEAKDAAAGVATTTLLTKAFGQVSNYARDLGERPPYIMVLDVGATLIVWDRWDGTYGGFHLGHRIDLRTLADRPADVALLRDIWTDPTVRDPRRYAQAITVEIAKLLAELASTLEGRGHDPERVARFLIRCVFSMFAEDVHLLPDTSFKRLLDAVQPQGSAAFVQAAETLWRAMDAGGMFGYHRLLRFNGHFFADAEALPLERAELELLRRAADADWAAVEPSIFGTLLVRALSPEERHRLGAEYTPRAFIERLVRPTVEEPVRERWTAVQAEVLQLQERGRATDLRQAEARLLDFHGWLRGLRILDPACGSGNFLYVTLHALKRVEVEVFRLLTELHGGQLGMRLDEIDPGQFHGIEVNAWAREIAELTLWIGFHQFWRQQHGDVQPDEPLLRDTGTLEQRDAVLAWDEIRHVPERDRPDPTPRLTHPVTGQLVPDPAARLPYYEYVNARPADWPEADFIVGNPPYLGKQAKRDALGDGYVDALQRAYPTVPPASDFVMLWWLKAAEAVTTGHCIRAGLITTNSVVQKQNRGVIEIGIEAGASVTWAIADHPWISGEDGAQVRVAMSVLEAGSHRAVIVRVDESGLSESARSVAKLNSDLSHGVDVVRAARMSLQSNAQIATVGFKPYGEGFVLTDDEARRLLAADPMHAKVIRPFRNGRDLAARSRDAWLMDLNVLGIDEAIANYPIIVGLLQDRVRPQRLANSNRDIRERWWQLGHNRLMLRDALRDIQRFIVTPETSRHRFFTFLPTEVAPDGALFCIALDSAVALGVLSSAIHLTWVSAMAGKLGVGNDARYNKSCFDPFPFPELSAELQQGLMILGERLDAHRAAALERDDRITMTGMYNVVAKLRSGEPLTAKERTIHELAACGVLRDLHDELDQLVADAYGWPWPMEREEILDRLVALHDERVAEEARGLVRWLRPDYQAPDARATIEEVEADVEATDASATETAPAPWPGEAVEQIAALKRLVTAAPLDVDAATARFVGARREIVARHLETLAILGEVRVGEEGRYSAASAS